MSILRPQLSGKVNKQQGASYSRWFAGLYKSIISGSILGIISVLATAPVTANDNANFGTISLAPGFDVNKAIVSGYTGGSYALSIIRNRDRDGNLCVGFADPTPDHILILQKDFEQLRLLVDSAGADTTILIQGPGNQDIRCGDDTGRKKDASLEVRNLKAGTYRVWVGVFNPGARVNYRFSIQPGN